MRVYLFSIIPLAAGLLLVSLLLVFIVIAIVAVVRRKISRASNSPSSQLELINNQKAENDLDYSPDIIPKDQGKTRSDTIISQCSSGLRSTHSQSFVYAVLET